MGKVAIALKPPRSPVPSPFFSESISNQLAMFFGRLSVWQSAFLRFETPFGELSVPPRPAIALLFLPGNRAIEDPKPLH